MGGGAEERSIKREFFKWDLEQNPGGFLCQELRGRFLCWSWLCPSIYLCTGMIRMRISALGWVMVFGVLFWFGFGFFCLLFGVFVCLLFFFFKSKSYECVLSFVSLHLSSRYDPTHVLSLFWEGEGGEPQQPFMLWYRSWRQAVLFFHALPSVVVVLFGLSWHLSLNADACSKNAAFLLWRWELPLPSVFRNGLLPLG